MEEMVREKKNDPDNRDVTGVARVPKTKTRVEGSLRSAVDEIKWNRNRV